MSRTTTREIIQICTELAKLDRRGKLEILNYLETELAKPAVERKKVTKYSEGGEQ